MYIKKIKTQLKSCLTRSNTYTMISFMTNCIYIFNQPSYSDGWWTCLLSVVVQSFWSSYTMFAQWMFFFYIVGGRIHPFFVIYFFLIPSMVCASLNFTRCKLDLRDLRWYTTCPFVFQTSFGFEIFKNVIPLLQ